MAAKPRSGKLRWRGCPSVGETTMSGARKGDLVRAYTDDRTGEWVEGILTIRYVALLNYIQVSGGDRFVDAATVTVIQRDVATPDAMDPDDPLFTEPGWRPYHDIDEALATGLVPLPRTRRGGTWAEMSARLDEAIAPMLAAGWVELPDQRDHDYDGDAGDLLGCQLVRGDAHLEVALREDDAIVVWDVKNSVYPDGTEDACMSFFVVEREHFQSEAAEHGRITLTN